MGWIGWRLFKSLVYKVVIKGGFIMIMVLFIDIEENEFFI